MNGGGWRERCFWGSLRLFHSWLVGSVLDPIILIVGCKICIRFTKSEHKFTDTKHNVAR